jgi:hypothetical protein
MQRIEGGETLRFELGIGGKRLKRLNGAFGMAARFAGINAREERGQLGNGSLNAHAIKGDFGRRPFVGQAVEEGQIVIHLAEKVEPV